MSSSEAPNVFIILVNWNGWSDTKECLQSLEKLDYPNFSAVLVDNGSDEPIADKIGEYEFNITLIECTENKGFAGGNNEGIKYALDHGADFMWLLNNDTVVEEGALSALVSRARENPKIGICGSKLLYYHYPDTIQALAGGIYNRWLGVTRNIGQNKKAQHKLSREEIERRLQYVAGASMLVSRSFIEEVGLLSEEYFLYYEEMDWAMRGEEKFDLGFAPESIVYHKEGASTGGNQLQQKERSVRADYYQLKNRLMFTYKFFPVFLPTVYLTVFYALIKRMIRGQWRRIPMIFKLMINFNK